MFAGATDITLYEKHLPWVRAQKAANRSVHAFNAGEINPQAGPFPGARRVAECARVVDAGGIVIVAGVGLKSVESAASVTFDPIFREAAVMSWRDQGSRDAAGFGDYAPDWAYSLGTRVAEWTPSEDRGMLAVTLRFDRPWPDAAWFAAVRAFAVDTDTRIVTLAQVARDAPRAVRLAEALEGEYLTPPSMSHDELDAHARDIYRRSLAAISDRAHGLIIAATEGAYPIGSGHDPQKISRMLSAVGLGGLVGRHDELPEFAARFDAHVSSLAPSISGARADLADLTARIAAAMDALA